VSKRNQYKRQQAQAVTQYQVSVLPVQVADDYADAYTVASAAARAYVLADGTGSRRHSGIVDATGVASLTSATTPIKSARSNSQAQAKFTDWRWNMSIRESVMIGVNRHIEHDCEDPTK
jgi:hypothetical protein